MQLLQLLLALVLVLLGTTGDFANGAKCGVKTASIDNLRTSEPIDGMNLAASPDTTYTQEERAGTNHGGAGRAIGGASVPVNGPTETATGKQITVTTYNGNGIFQRVGKWWNRTFGGTRRLRQ
ncbi:hypothetical protein DVH05_002862 [Phytophthora capsici]|nr:hypothetical protein DVH05_002862 [Phytophthora capsici]